MMSDRYIRQFYQFTQHNIAGISAAPKFEEKTSVKVFISAALVVLMLTLGITLARLWPSAINDTSHLAIKPQMQSEPRYVSQIPKFRVAARRQLVSAMPRGKSAIVALNDDDQLNESLVVMDKVVVIPKVIS